MLGSTGGGKTTQNGSVALIGSGLVRTLAFTLPWLEQNLLSSIHANVDAFWSLSAVPGSALETLGVLAVRNSSFTQAVLVEDSNLASPEMTNWGALRFRAQWRRVKLSFTMAEIFANRTGQRYSFFIRTRPDLQFLGNTGRHVSLFSTTQALINHLISQLALDPSTGQSTGSRWKRTVVSIDYAVRESSESRQS